MSLGSFFDFLLVSFFFSSVLFSFFILTPFLQLFSVFFFFSLFGSIVVNCFFFILFYFILFYFVVVFFIVCCAYLFILILYDLAKGRCKRIHLYFSAKNRSCVLAIDIHKIMSLVQPSHNTSFQANQFALFKSCFSIGLFYVLFQ